MTNTSNKHWKNCIKDIVQVTLTEGGAAFKLERCQFLPAMDSWSFPKYPGRTRILPQGIDLVAALQEFIAANEELLNDPGCWLGTWINPHTREYYLDVATGCEDLEEAKRVAFEASQRDGRQIVALYNSLRRETIYL